MNNLPLVSIVVITYNSSKYVLETLESAKAQTYQNIELIISDDCSTDETVMICEEWIVKNGDRFVRTKLITIEKNTGTSVNCNRGCRAANGIWIKLIAGDDLLLTNCIECFVQYAKEHPDKKLLFSKIKLLINKQYSLQSFNDEFWEDSYKLFNSLSGAQKQYEYLIKKGNFVPTATNFMNKALWAELGGFDEDILLLEDYPFWIKATSKGYELTQLQETLCSYRVSDNSIQVSNIIIFSCRLCAHKYIWHTPLYSLIFPYIDQLDKKKIIKSMFLLRILDIIALLLIRIPNKLIYWFKLLHPLGFS
jgi:alpha-1,3-rhamnosyltransferase